jgi:amidase
MSVQGVLARTVADVRAGLAAMSARDTRDPWWVPAPLEGPPVPRRVAVLRELDGESTDPSVLAALDRAAAALAEAGYEVVDVDEAQTPGVKVVADLAFRLMMAELNHQLVPVLERFGSEQMREYWRVIGALAEPYDTLGEHIDDLARRTTLMRAWLGFLETHPVLVIPELLGPLLTVDEDVRSEADSIRVWHSLRPSIAVNLLGLPSALAPTGLDGVERVDGVDGSSLPTGVQLVASRYREDVALAAAEVVESATGVLTPRLWERSLP